MALLSFITSQWTPERLSVIFSLISPLVALLGAAYVLWRQADGISSRMVQGIREDKTSPKLGLQELQIVGFSVVGLVIVATAVTDTFRILPTFTYPTNFNRGELAYFFLEKAVSMGIGLLLLLRSRGIVRVISGTGAALYNLDSGDLGNENLKGAVNISVNIPCCSGSGSKKVVCADSGQMTYDPWHVERMERGSDFMKTKPIAFLACRILAISFFLRTLAGYSTLFTFLPANLGKPVTPNVMLAVVMALAWLLFGSGILWVLADRLSSFMVRGFQDDEVGIQLEPNELQVAGFCIVGLIILAQTIPSVFQGITRFSYFSKTELTYFILEKAVRIGLGLFLMLGSRSIFRVISSIRTVGLGSIDE